MQSKAHTNHKWSQQQYSSQIDPNDYFFKLL